VDRECPRGSMKNVEIDATTQVANADAERRWTRERDGPGVAEPGEGVWHSQA